MVFQTLFSNLKVLGEMSNQLWKMKSEGQWRAASDIFYRVMFRMSDDGMPDTNVQFYFGLYNLDVL